MSFIERVGKAWDTTSEIVDVEGIKIEVRSMSSRDRVRLLSAVASDEGKIDAEKWFPTIILTTCFDPDTGEKAFTPEDVEWLQSRASGPVEKLAHAGLRLSGMAGDSVDEAKKDSSTTPSDAGISD